MPLATDLGIKGGPPTMLGPGKETATKTSPSPSLLRMKDPINDVSNLADTVPLCYFKSSLSINQLFRLADENEVAHLSVGS